MPPLTHELSAGGFLDSRKYGSRNHELERFSGPEPRLELSSYQVAFQYYFGIQ
jgi:hypothetical protein